MSSDEQKSCSNYRIAVVSLVRWMDFNSYEVDARKLLRISLCVINDLPRSRDVVAALMILRIIVEHGPNEAQDFLDSIINACKKSLSRDAHTKPVWMPDDYVDAAVASSFEPDCESLALEILQILPKKYTPQQLRFQKVAPMVMRLLAENSGEGSRKFRQIARMARASWSLVQV